jgi:hypothetical protein
LISMWQWKGERRMQARLKADNGVGRLHRVVRALPNENRVTPGRMSSTEVAIALVVLALMSAVCAVGVQLRHLIL